MDVLGSHSDFLIKSEQLKLSITIKGNIVKVDDSMSQDTQKSQWDRLTYDWDQHQQVLHYQWQRRRRKVQRQGRIEDCLEGWTWGLPGADHEDTSTGADGAAQGSSWHGEPPEEHAAPVSAPAPTERERSQTSGWHGGTEDLEREERWLNFENKMVDNRQKIKFPQSVH